MNDYKVEEIMDAILKINPNAKFNVAGNIDGIEWTNGTTPIPKADIEVKVIEVQAEYDAKQYQRDRSKEYPSIADQLDKIYHSGLNEWKKVIKATKDKYPK